MILIVFFKTFILIILIKVGKLQTNGGREKERKKRGKRFLITWILREK